MTGPRSGGKRAVVLIDHGSKRPEANAVVERMAELVQQALPYDVVRYAHMESAGPTLAEAFAACVAAGAGEIVVHPYFLGPGRHTTDDIPRLVADAAARHPGLRARLADPLGADEKIVEVILERVRAARAGGG
jgi:sirohydrochlorin ferrochelatase